MKSLLAISLLSLSISLGSLIPSKVMADDKDNACNVAKAMATAAMTLRQTGKSVHEFREKMEKETGQEMSETLLKFLLSLSKLAHEQPRFSLPEKQNQATEDFANTIVIECNEAFAKAELDNAQ